MRNNYNLKNKYYQNLDKILKQKLIEQASIQFEDRPELLNSTLEKIEKNLNVFKFVDKKYLKDREVLFEHLVEDVIQREIDYVQKLRNVKQVFSLIEDKFVILSTILFF